VLHAPHLLDTHNPPLQPKVFISPSSILIKEFIPVTLSYMAMAPSGGQGQNLRVPLNSSNENEYGDYGNNMTVSPVE